MVGITLYKVEGNFGICFFKERQYFRQNGLSHGSAGANVQGACLNIVQLGQFGLKGGIGLEYLFGILYQHFAGYGKRYVVAIAFKQLYAQLLFQLLNVLGNSGLGNKQLVGSLGKT
jgi:hypothetical protein